MQILFALERRIFSSVSDTHSKPKTWVENKTGSDKISLSFLVGSFFKFISTNRVIRLFIINGGGGGAKRRGALQERNIRCGVSQTAPTSGRATQHRSS